jgi:hypothetical protein
VKCNAAYTLPCPQASVALLERGAAIFQQLTSLFSSAEASHHRRELGRHSLHGSTSDIAKSKHREHGSDSVTLESATFEKADRDTRPNTSTMQSTHTISSTRPLAARSNVSATDEWCTRSKSMRLPRTGQKPPAAVSQQSASTGSACLALDDQCRVLFSKSAGSHARSVQNHSTAQRATIPSLSL